MYFNRYNITWITVLGILFFLSYGAVNHLTAHIDTINPVQSFIFDWEKHIPFVPIFIWPYMSIDFLYGLAFFIIAKNQYSEKDYHFIIKGLGLQLLVNQLYSLLCFLSFPLKFSFDKPQIPKLTSLFLDALLSFDLPYNQAPSLHISILIILTVFYNQHLRNSIIKWALNTWFLLIGLSVVFTYQHHFIDIVLGAYLGLGIVLMFNYSVNYKPSLHIEQKLTNTSIYKKYVLGIMVSSMLIYIAPILGHIKLINYEINNYVYILLLISHISLLTCFKIMFFGNHFNIRNENNHFTWSFLVVGYIYIKAKEMFISFFNYYEEPFKVNDRLFIGNFWTIKKVKPSPDKVFINLTWEFDNRKDNSISLPLVDLVVPNTDQLKQISDKINEVISSGKTVYIHCAFGLFRTLLILSTYLVLYEKKKVEEVISLLENSTLSSRIKYYLSGHKDKLKAIVQEVEEKKT